jgi:16S rRNA (cytosine1407-C5)-methyltransferase
LDAPCSGEGRFIGTSPETYKNWYLKDVFKCSSLQKKLIKSAFLSLKRGGVLVYSTCTLNLAEDEEVLNYALDNFDLEVMDIDLKISSGIKAKTDNNDIMIYNDSDNFYNKSIEKAIRIIPTKLMEGFFVARLKKK